MLIDTHAHLYLEHFEDDLPAVMQRCQQNNVVKSVLPNIDSATLPQLEKVVRQFPKRFLPAIGLHPCSVKEDFIKELETLKKYIDSLEENSAFQKIYGIGEIGLDYYWDTSFKEQQKEVLATQINWAKELKLPIILHCRDSFDDLYEIVKNLNGDNLSGIFHCFSGTLEEAQKIMQLDDFYMGIGGVITFKKSKELRAVVKEIPMEYLVVETDAPYLTPVPFRGKRNESSYVLHVAEIIATVKQMPLDEVEMWTTQNAKKVFRF